MVHILNVDYQAKELDDLLSGEKRMIIRDAAGRKIPYGRVDKVASLDPFAIDKTDYGNLDDSLPVGDIADVRKIAEGNV